MAKRQDSRNLDRTRTMTAATVYLTRRRGVVALVVLISVVAMSVFLLTRDKKKTKSASAKEQLSIIGLDDSKQLHCYSDADCPDNTFCDPRGMCNPNEMLPIMPAQPIIIPGRGRGGEGSDAVRDSPGTKSQGQ